MGNNQSKMDALNSQMNLLVESQAQEIKELKEEISNYAGLVMTPETLQRHVKQSGMYEKLKERQMIMGAVADEHINDMNGIHKDYGDMVRKLKEEIETLKEMRVDDKIYNEEVLSKLMKENKELNDENEKLNKDRQDLGNRILKMKMDCVCETIPEVEEEIKKLTEENENLKISAKGFCDTIKENENQISSMSGTMGEIYKENEKLKEELVDTKNKLEVATGFCESQINSLIEQEYHRLGPSSQISIDVSWFSEFMKPHAYKFIDVIIKKLTTHASSGYGAYTDGYWYSLICKSHQPYTLQHDGSGCVCINMKEDSSSSEEEEEDVSANCGPELDYCGMPC